MMVEPRVLDQIVIESVRVTLRLFDLSDSHRYLIRMNNTKNIVTFPYLLRL